MLKRLIFLLLNVLIVSAAVAQQQIRIQCTNQYETTLSLVSVTVAGQTTDYTTDKAGFTTITVPACYSLTITAANHKPHTMAIASLHSTEIIVLEKQFTWKDLLNPMFYIVYGGFFLLLFIVFAETGLFVGFFLPGNNLLFVAGFCSPNLADNLFKNFGMTGTRPEWLDLLV